ncbi:MAG TPA: hypothetical protein VGU23_06670 [Acidobacteriaceae bacterium]|nr:hypothetical protein [Acidobacteriaceae bacterium]
MNARRSPASSRLAARAPIASCPALVLLLCLVPAGCRHKVAPYTLPVGPQVPLALESPADPTPAAIAAEPAPDFGPLPAVNPPPPTPRRRPGPKEEAVQPPATGEPAPADLAIGSLSSGLDATPQIQQQARDLIASIHKRIAALSARTAEAQKQEVRQVRRFLDQAQQALSTGDTEGAKNLATKAGLLMDDLEKK